MIHKVSKETLMELDIVLGRAHDLENSFPSSKFLKIQVVGLVTQWKHRVERRRDDLAVVLQNP